MNQPTFHSFADGRLFVDQFTDELLVTPELLRTALPRYIQRKGFRRFAIVCENATATYRIASRDREQNVLQCQMEA